MALKSEKKHNLFYFSIVNLRHQIFRISILAQKPLLYNTYQGWTRPRTLELIITVEQLVRYAK